ncbi:hypothetical protein QYE76_025366 [Lolium multiflorum]|uniref:Transposase (putative) gypsy type domain-containing protein n=1 Tax=Lolium multiflorum TaxID=4521 RepID=A0AAD8VUK8_LOLMU|nr:hypothetical protein QYE76_025366 [Lolium multiflorum]
MGKKKSASTSDAAKVSRDWSASAISNRDVNKLRALGFISASEDDIRLPGAISRTRPPKGFTVMFVAFLFRGLSLPAHEFLRSLLFFYGQLTPNSILHLSIFITICEAFLGIDPHWGLWRKIFYVKRHNDSNAPPSWWRWPLSKGSRLPRLSNEGIVQGWRNKWFYLRDPAVSGQRSNLPPFEDKLVAKPKKSWQNALSPEERVIADKLFDQVVALKNTGGLTMCGTEVVSVFLQRRVQPLMSRPHQLWLYTGKDDESRVSSADLSAEDLRDEVRRLTCLSAKDNIVLMSARPPYDSQHLPTEVPAVAQCYPPTPESGVEPEDDDDNSEETEAPSMPSRTAMSKMKKLPRMTLSSGAGDVSRYTKSLLPRLNQVLADRIMMPLELLRLLPPRKVRRAFSPLKTTWTLLEANRLVAKANNENILLKDELKKLKQQLKDEQDARREAAAAIDKKEGVLRESITNLLKAADITITRARMLREDSTSDALSLATESNVQVLGFCRTKGALSRLYSMIFPKAKQVKTLGELADAFLVDPSEPVEVLKRRNRLFGAVLTFQLLMGHGMGSELEELSKALPVDDDNHLVDLEPFKRSAVTCANQLLKLVDEAQTKPTTDAAPESSSAL